MSSRIKKIVLLILKLADIMLSYLMVPLQVQKGITAARKLGRRKVLAALFDGQFNAYEEISRNTELIISALKRANIDHIVFKRLDQTVSIAVIDSADRSLEAVQALDLEGYYYETHRDKNNSRIGRLASRLPKRVGSIRAISFYRHLTTDGARAVNGKPYQVTLEFWTSFKHSGSGTVQRVMDEFGISDKQALKGALIASIGNDIGRIFAPDTQKRSTTKIYGKNYPTLQIFKEKLLAEVTFPIDIVYTWVDGSDPLWLEKYEEHRRLEDPNYSNNSMSRYSDHDELRHSLRSAEMYAPWVRNIYIVTMGQRPKWLKKSSGKVKIIDHKDVFTDPSVLPVFNSHAIETQLHHIDGLSEHFLYLNDDILFTNMTRPSDFFFANGVARVQPSSAQIGTGNPVPGEVAPSSAGKNARKLLKKELSVYITDKFRHVPHPQIKTASQDIERVFSRLVASTMKSRFRDPSDIPFTSILSQSYLLGSGKGVPAPIHTRTINISDRGSVKALLDLERDPECKTVCINEGTDRVDRDVITERMSRYLGSNFPFKSRYEI